MKISSKSKIIIHTHLNIKMNPTNCIFVLFKGWPGKNMNGYQHCHYYQLKLIIIIIKCFITIFSPGWLRWAGSSVSLSTSCRSARGSFHLSFQISIRTSSFFFDHWYTFLNIFWSSHRMRRPLKQSSWSLSPGVWCGFKQLHKRIRNWVRPSCDMGSRICKRWNCVWPSFQIWLKLQPCQRL